MSVKKAVELVREVKKCFPDTFEVNVIIMSINELLVSAIDTQIDLEARFHTTPSGFKTDCIRSQIQMQDLYEKKQKDEERKAEANKPH